MRLASFVLLALLASACTRATPDPGATKDPSTSSASPASPPPSTPVPAVAIAAPPRGEIDPKLAPEAKELFLAYKAWGRVDDEMRWAPWLCRMPLPGRPHMSAADDGGHARKLYSLFAKDRASYVSLGSATAKPAPLTGQVIAKESWVPELVKDVDPKDARGRSDAFSFGDPGDSGTDTPERPGDHFHRYFRDGDKLYRAAALAGVYFMWKKDASTPGTDEGWVYATLTPSGEVTSAGRVASCMRCHASAKHERLFGLAAKK